MNTVTIMFILVKNVDVELVGPYCVINNLKFVIDLIIQASYIFLLYILANTSVL